MSIALSNRIAQLESVVYGFSQPAVDLHMLGEQIDELRERCTKLEGELRAMKARMGKQAKMSEAG